MKITAALSRILLAATLILPEAAPVLAAFQEAPGARGQGPVAVTVGAAPLAAPGLDPWSAALNQAGGVSGLPILSRLDALRLAEPGSAGAELAGLLQAAAIQADLRADAGLRAAIVEALGPSALAEVDRIGAGIDRSASSDPALRRWIQDSATERAGNAKAIAARLEQLRGAFAARSLSDGSLAVAGSESRGAVLLIKGKPQASAAKLKPVEKRSVSPVARAGRSLLRSLRTATVALMIGAGAITAAPNPALAQPRSPPAAAQQQVQEDRVIHVGDINQLKSQWSPDHAVYVIGDFGGTLNESDLRELAGYLKGRHWTIVLLPSFSGQSFRDKDGNARSDQSAVEYFLSQVIESDSRFQGQKNELGESDGKIWFWGRDEKHRDYIGSEAQNKRNLGTDQYKNMGPLDAPWLAQMRQNRDVVKAVQRMADNIDDQLKSAVEGELASAGSQTRSAADKVSELRAALANLAKNPAAAKAAGSFDVAGLKAKADRAQTALSANQPAKALQLSGEAISGADAALARVNGALGAFTAAQNAIAQAESSISDLDAKTSAFRKNVGRDLGGDIGSTQVVSDLRAQLNSAKSDLSAGRSDAAQASAKGVVDKAATALSAMESYSNAGAALTEASDRLAKIEKDAYAGEARAQILTAKQAIADAQTAYRDGNSTYQQSLQTAQASVKSAETVVSDARASHDAAVRGTWAGLIGLLLTLLTLGGLLNFRARRSRKETAAELGTWESILTDEQAKRYTETDAEVKRWIGASAADFNYEGETARIADDARVTFELMKRLWEKAKTTIESAQALARPSFGTPRWFWNQLFPGNFRKALNSLKQPLDFLPEEGLDQKLGLVRSTALKQKLGKVGKGKEYSFQDIMSLYDDMKDSVTQAFTTIKTSKAKVAPELDRIDGVIDQAKAKKSALDAAGKDDGLFLAPTLFTDLLPAASQTIAQAREKIAKDPVGALSKNGAKAESISAYAAGLSDAILGARAGALSEIAKNEAALKAGGISTDWVDQAVNSLSGAAEAAAADGAQAVKNPSGVPAADKIDAFKRKVADQAGRAARAAKHEQTLRAVALPSIEAVKTAVAGARVAIAKKLGLKEEDILVEKETADMDAEIQAALDKKAASKSGTLEPSEIEGVMKEIHESRTLDPIAKLSKASEQAAKAKAHLDAGQVDEAAQALDAAGDFHDVAVAILDRTMTAFASQDETVAARRAETARLEKAVPAAQAALARIRKTYADSVLKLTAGDAAHPSADGTVDNNVDEVNEHLADAKDKTDKAVEAFKTGALLRAAALLDQALAHQELAQYRLTEVSEKEARLTAAVAANAAALAELDRRSQGELAQIWGDPVSQQPTVAAVEAARKSLESARTAVNAAKGDPFQSAALLTQVKADFDRIKGIAQNDHDLHGHASSTVSSAGAAMESARQQARAAKAEPGSSQDAAITRSLRDLDGLEVRFQRAQVGLCARHGDWHALDSEAGDVAAQAGRIAAALRQEVAAADAAQAAIDNAARKVREATSWSGSYGVTVPGSPGSGSVSSARSYLDSGDYAQAQREAEQAVGLAVAAIAAAEAEVARLRREEEERRRQEEEERRRRQEEEEERERRARDSSSSYGGGGSSWGGGSSGGYGGGGSSFGGGSSGGY